MRRTNSPLLYLTVSLFFLTVLMQKAHSQEPLIGIWEGVFMEQYQIRLVFEQETQDQFVGNILMYAEKKLIQDDKIVDISFINETLKFYIPAKNTLFKGSMTSQLSELSGNFIFPDSSLHAIHLAKTSEQTEPNKSFDSELLKKDLEFIYSSLIKYHPRVFSYTSKDSMDVLVDKLKKKINNQQNINEFYFLASTITDNLHCSHTGIRLPMTYQKQSNTTGNFFPLKLYFIENQAFFISGKTPMDNPILPGNEIIRINGRPVKEIAAELFLLIPAEYQNLSTKYHFLNNEFNELYYHLDRAEKFIIQYKQGGEIENTIIPSIRKEDLKDDDQDMKKNNLMDFEYLENEGIGKLRISSFAIHNMEDYFQELDRIFLFLESNGIKNLILDLRDNSGGHPIYAAQLLSYLTRKKFTYFKRNEDVEEFQPLYNPMIPNKLNFQGTLYVFVNGGCLSTTGHLISLLAFYTNAIFIGEEPGSTYQCNDKSIQLICPTTKLEINIPTTTFETTVKGHINLDTFPLEYKVSKSVFDIIKEKDGYLEIVKEINTK